MSEPRKPSRWALWLPLIIFAGFVGLVMLGVGLVLNRRMEQDSATEHRQERPLVTA